MQEARVSTKLTFKSALGMQLDGSRTRRRRSVDAVAALCGTAVAPTPRPRDWASATTGPRLREWRKCGEPGRAGGRVENSGGPRPLAIVFRDAARQCRERVAARAWRAGGPTTNRALHRGPGLEVERLQSPPQCSIGAERGDLLEVRYEGRLRQDNKLFDGSAITFADGRAVPGRGGDASLYFVLGKQPVGQFPPAWDAALSGCCVGEVRKLAVPPVLGFGDKGAPKRGVPPYAPLDTRSSSSASTGTTSRDNHNAKGGAAAAVRAFIQTPLASATCLSQSRDRKASSWRKRRPEGQAAAGEEDRRRARVEIGPKSNLSAVGAPTTSPDQVRHRMRWGAPAPTACPVYRRFARQKN